jgi:hypothetical protein
MITQSEWEGTPDIHRLVTAKCVYALPPSSQWIMSRFGDPLTHLQLS